MDKLPSMNTQLQLKFTRIQCCRCRINGAKMFTEVKMLAAVSSRLRQLLSVPRRGITSLTKDNSRRTQKRYLNYEVVIPAKVCLCNIHY